MTIKARLVPLGICWFAFGCGGAQIEQQKTAMEQAQQEAGKLRGQLAERDQKLAALAQEKFDLDSRIFDLAGKLQASQTRTDSLVKSNEDLSTSIQASQGQLAKKVKELVAEKDELNRKLAELRKDRINAKAGYREKLETAKSAQDKLSAEAMELRQELASLKAPIEKAEADRRARVARAHEDFGTLADAVAKEVQSGQASVVQDGPAVRLTLQEPLLFKPQEAKLTEEGTALLERLGATFRGFGDRTLRVEGHSDNSPIKWDLFGRFTSHWDLSSARATAVARYLHEHGGIEPRRMTASGFGEFRPIGPNDTAEGKAANRRIVLILE